MIDQRAHILVMDRGQNYHRYFKRSTYLAAYEKAWHFCTI